MSMNTTDALLMAAFGGGTKTVIIPRKEINFLDIKGNVFRAYDKTQFLALTEMPNPPSADGMKPRGWNWTLPEAKAAVEANGTLDVAPEYDTNDGSTRIYVHFEEGRSSPFIRIENINGTVTLDFGDGSPIETKSGTGQTTDYLPVQHTFAPGDYVIKVTPTVEGTTYVLPGENQKGSRILQKTLSGENLEGYVYKSSIRKVEMGVGAKLGNQAFQDCFSLASISLPSDLTEIPTDAFRSCIGLKSVSVPKGVTTIDQYAFSGCTNLEQVSLPNTITTINTNAFSSCRKLTDIVLPGSTTSLGSSALSSCFTLVKICIPSGVSSISTSLLQNCYGLSNLRFTGLVAPSPSSSNWYSNIPTDCIIEVPYGGLASYLSASNYPKKTTYTYLGYATYTSGAALPAQDGTEAYNVTWYATRADAKAGTNPITEGNGNEIYCTYAAVTA